jgi:cytochrome b561
LVRNSVNDWGWPARLFHWLTTALILVLLAHGWWMTHMVAQPSRLANYSWHAAIGYDLLVLLVLRLVWRLSGNVPALPEGSKRWERIAAGTGHAFLYLLAFATTLVGWVLAGTMRTPLTKDLFGLNFPPLYAQQDHTLHRLLENGHRILAYLLAALVVVHVAGALRHHFIKGNDVLRRMLRPVSPTA